MSKKTCRGGGSSESLSSCSSWGSLSSPATNACKPAASFAKRAGNPLAAILSQDVDVFDHIVFGPASFRLVGSIDVDGRRPVRDSVGIPETHIDGFGSL